MLQRPFFVFGLGKMLLHICTVIERLSEGKKENSAGGGASRKRTGTTKIDYVHGIIIC